LQQNLPGSSDETDGREKRLGAAVEIKRGDIGCRRLLDGLFFTRRKFRLKLVGNRFRNFTLNRENVGKIAIVSLSPEMRIVARVDELRVDADAISRPLHAAFQ
jgi:hypothetical protein